MKKQVLSALMILLVGFGSMLQLSAYVHRDLDFKNHPYIKLIPPPPEALASDFGSPLVTVDIGLFAYYEAADWDLNDVIPAFHNYTQHSNYVDGYVRVWNDVDDTDFEGDAYYIDVSVRVRSDGWILAWINDDQNKAFICHVGGETVGLDFENHVPEEEETCLSRAVHRVYHNAGVSWIGYDAVYYYDYEYPDATRLMLFGESLLCVGAPTEHVYFIIPSTTTLESCWISGIGRFTSGEGIYLDEAIVFQSGGDLCQSSDVTASIVLDTRHDVKVTIDGATGLGLFCSVAVWTS